MPAAASWPGLGDVRFHDLRHSCATLMLAAGVRMDVISKLLGHSSVGVTAARYAHLQVGEMRAGLEAAFGVSQSPAHAASK